jgi:hypothetical protein
MPANTDIMRLRCIVIIATVLLLAFQAAAQDKSPAQAYTEYHKAVIKAETLSEILPYLSHAYRLMLESRPRENHRVWLTNLKEDLVTDLKITKETVAGNSCTLEATGKSKRGNMMKGKIVLVKEGDSWKLDEQLWITSY